MKHNDFCRLYVERKIGIAEVIRRGQEGCPADPRFGAVMALCELAGYLEATLAGAERRIRTGDPWEHRLPEEPEGTRCAGGAQDEVTQVLLDACEAAFHELRIRCGYKPGDSCYDELKAALARAGRRMP